ncbi:MAG: glycoside hydrolase family 26 protein [Streptosporangiaceae bacterium]
MSSPVRTATIVTATIVVVIAAAAAAVASVRHYHSEAAAAQAGEGSLPSQHVPTVVHASLPATPASYLGVYEGSTLSTAQYAQVEQFAQAVGRQPNIVMYYSGWGEGFSVPFAQTALKYGATLQIDIDPTNTSVASIAAGQQDAFLQSYANSVKIFGHPVIISFGHEMNGDWYTWGWTQTSPAVFVAAWRHIVDVFRQFGADNVTWMWTVNAVTDGEGPIADYWPGKNYVTWTSFDAYYYNASEDFTSVFQPTVTAIRQLTNDPILIGETAIGQDAGQAAKIPGLFAGIASSGLLGFIWYDQGQDSGTYHQDWRLEGNSAAVAAFRASAQQYLQQPPAPATSSP